MGNSVAQVVDSHESPCHLRMPDFKHSISKHPPAFIWASKPTTIAQSPSRCQACTLHGSCRGHACRRRLHHLSTRQGCCQLKFSALHGSCRGHACTRPPDHCPPARRPDRRLTRVGCSWPPRARTGPGCAPAPSRPCTLAFDAARTSIARRSSSGHWMQHLGYKDVPVSDMRRGVYQPYPGPERRAGEHSG